MPITNLESYQKFDLAIKVLLLILSVCGFLYGMYTYKEQSEREFKKPFLAAQITACKEITELVAEVSAIKSIDGRAEYADKLSILYFSRGSLFLNNEALIEFQTFIRAMKECPGKKEINECNHLNLGSYQFNIAHACRNELIKSWSGDLKNLVEELHDPLL
ncbi:hypothetical protein THIOSC15_1290066 [uncultured Thiomicrorhabdus sp.]